MKALARRQDGPTARLGHAGRKRRMAQVGGALGATLAAAVPRSRARRHLQQRCAAAESPCHTPVPSAGRTRRFGPGPALSDGAGDGDREVGSEDHRGRRCQGRVVDRGRRRRGGHVVYDFDHGRRPRNCPSHDDGHACASHDYDGAEADAPVRTTEVLTRPSTCEVWSPRRSHPGHRMRRPRTTSTTTPQSTRVPAALTTRTATAPALRPPAPLAIRVPASTPRAPTAPTPANLTTRRDGPSRAGV